MRSVDLSSVLYRGGLFLYRLDFSYFVWPSKRVRVAAALRSDSGKPYKWRLWRSADLFFLESLIVNEL